MSAPGSCVITQGSTSRLHSRGLVSELCVSRRSNAQLEDLHQHHSASVKHRKHRTDTPIQPQTAARPPVSSQQELADSAAEMAGGVSLTEKKRKKRRKTEADMNGLQPANALSGGAMGINAEPSAPGHHDPAQEGVPPATALHIKSEDDAAQRRLSRKQRKKLGLSVPDRAAAVAVPIKAEPEADTTDLQAPEHMSSAPVQNADLSGLSKKQRKKLRMSMPDPGLLSKMSLDTGVDWVPDSMKGHNQGGLQSMTPGQIYAAAGGRSIVKEEEGNDIPRNKTHNGQQTSAGEQVKKEPELSNGHDIDRLASSLPGSSRKKHKKSRNSESHP